MRIVMVVLLGAALTLGLLLTRDPGPGPTRAVARHPARTGQGPVPVASRLAG